MNLGSSLSFQKIWNVDKLRTKVHTITPLIAWKKDKHRERTQWMISLERMRQGHFQSHIVFKSAEAALGKFLRDRAATRFLELKIVHSSLCPRTSLNSSLCPKTQELWNLQWITDNPLGIPLILTDWQSFIGGSEAWIYKLFLWKSDHIIQVIST